MVVDTVPFTNVKNKKKTIRIDKNILGKEYRK
jgi:hypothetical protein